MTTKVTVDGSSMESQANNRSSQQTSSPTSTNPIDPLDEITEMIWASALDISTSDDFSNEVKYLKARKNTLAHYKAKLNQLILEKQQEALTQKRIGERPEGWCNICYRLEPYQVTEYYLKRRCKGLDGCSHKHHEHEVAVATLEQQLRSNTQLNNSKEDIR